MYPLSFSYAIYIKGKTYFIAFKYILLRQSNFFSPVINKSKYFFSVADAFKLLLKYIFWENYNKF